MVNFNRYLRLLFCTAIILLTVHTPAHAQSNSGECYPSLGGIGQCMVTSSTDCGFDVLPDVWEESFDNSVNQGNEVAIAIHIAVTPVVVPLHLVGEGVSTICCCIIDFFSE